MPQPASPQAKTQQRNGGLVGWRRRPSPRRWRNRTNTNQSTSPHTPLLLSASFSASSEWTWTSALHVTIATASAVHAIRDARYARLRVWAADWTDLGQRSQHRYCCIVDYIHPSSVHFTSLRRRPLQLAELQQPAHHTTPQPQPHHNHATTTPQPHHTRAAPRRD